MFLLHNILCVFHQCSKLEPSWCIFFCVPGAVLPVGGLLLGESFIEPLSGRLVRVGGGSIRGGKVVPHSGGFQALLDSQALAVRWRLVELLRACCEEWSSGTLELHREVSRLRNAASELEQAWRSSQHCMLQLLSRLEAQQEWAWSLAEDGGSVGRWIQAQHCLMVEQSLSSVVVCNDAMNSKLVILAAYKLHQLSHCF